MTVKLGRPMEAHEAAVHEFMEINSAYKGIDDLTNAVERAVASHANRNQDAFKSLNKNLEVADKARGQLDEILKNDKSDPKRALTPDELDGLKGVLAQKRVWTQTEPNVAERPGWAKGPMDRGEMIRGFKDVDALTQNRMITRYETNPRFPLSGFLSLNDVPESTLALMRHIERYEPPKSKGQAGQTGHRWLNVGHVKLLSGQIAETQRLMSRRFVEELNGADDRYRAAMAGIVGLAYEPYMEHVDISGVFPFQSLRKEAQGKNCREQVEMLADFGPAVFAGTPGTMRAKLLKDAMRRGLLHHAEELAQNMRSANIDLRKIMIDRGGGGKDGSGMDIVAPLMAIFNAFTAGKAKGGGHAETEAPETHE